MARKSSFSFAAIIPILPYLAIGVVAWLIYRKVAGGQASFDLVAPSDIPSPQNLPKPDYVYQTIAERQFNAMNAWGTDTTSLFASLQGLTPLELVAVASAFGKRASTISLFPTTQQSISFSRNLFEWYDSELSGSDLSKMHAIWAATGLY
jgi:hypothetical protein